MKVLFWITLFFAVLFIATQVVIFISAQSYARARDAQQSIRITKRIIFLNQFSRRLTIVITIVVAVSLLGVMIW